MTTTLAPSDLLFDKVSYDVSLQITSSPYLLSLLPNTCFQLPDLPASCTGEEFFISEMKIVKANNEFPKLIGISTNVLVDSYNVEEITNNSTDNTTKDNEQQQKEQRAISNLTIRPKYPFVIHPKTETLTEHHLIRSTEGQYSQEYIKAVGLIDNEHDILHGLLFGELQNSHRASFNRQPSGDDGDLMADESFKFTIIDLPHPYSFIVNSNEKKTDNQTPLIIVKEEKEAVGQHAFINYLRDVRALQCRDEAILQLYNLEPTSDAYMIFSVTILRRYLRDFYRRVIGQLKPWKFLTSETPIKGISLFKPSIPVASKDICIAVADATKGGQWMWKSPMTPPDEDKTDYTIRLDVSISGFKRKTVNNNLNLTVFPRFNQTPVQMSMKQ